MKLTKPDALFLHSLLFHVLTEDLGHSVTTRLQDLMSDMEDFLLDSESVGEDELERDVDDEEEDEEELEESEEKHSDSVEKILQKIENLEALLEIEKNRNKAKKEVENHFGDKPKSSITWVSKDKRNNDLYGE